MRMDWNLSGLVLFLSTNFASHEFEQVDDALLWILRFAGICADDPKWKRQQQTAHLTASFIFNAALLFSNRETKTMPNSISSTNICLSHSFVLNMFHLCYASSTQHAIAIRSTRQS